VEDIHLSEEPGFPDLSEPWLEATEQTGSASNEATKPADSGSELIDLTGEGTGADRPDELTQRRFDRARHREWARVFLAGCILLCVPGTLAGGWALVFIHPERMKDTNEFLIATLSTLSGLAGAIIGFYFGGHRERDLPP
jgi:hypothetical protein